IYYANNTVTSDKQSQEETESTERVRIKRLLNNYLSVIDTLYFQKKGQKYFYTLDDKNHLIRKTLQGKIPKLNPYEGFSVTSNSGDVQLTAKISLEKFFKDYSSYHFLGNTSYKFVYANGKLTDIGPDPKESITIPSPSMEIINAEIEEGLRGNY